MESFTSIIGLSIFLFVMYRLGIIELLFRVFFGLLRFAISSFFEVTIGMAIIGGIVWVITRLA